MKAFACLVPLALLVGCAGSGPSPGGRHGGADSEAGASAVAACKSALALRSGQNTVVVLPVSHVPSAGGYEVFLSLHGASWLCTTDARGNVNRLEAR